jgi:DNA-directed RNA polymerase subunit RPC12/RpoP
MPGRWSVVRDQLQFSDQPMEVVMKCFICAAESNEVPSSGDYKQIACPECGEYKISGTAIALFKEHNWKFNIEEARRWIASHQGSGTIPMIDSNRAASLL